MAGNPYSGNPSQRQTVKTTDDGKRSDTNNRARIWNVFKPTIVLDEMSLESTGAPDAKNKTEDFASLNYPLIKINDYYFADSEINSMTINSQGFLPTITLSVTLTNRLFLSKHMPKDGDIISVMIRNKNDILTPIRNDYVITGAPSKTVLPNDRSPVTFTFFGELFVPGLKSFLGSNSYRGTSMETLKRVAEFIQLGFNTNEDNTNDHQVWLLSGGLDKFIEEVCLKSWKEENSFFDCWIDVYYNLNFIDSNFTN